MLCKWSAEEQGYFTVFKTGSFTRKVRDSPVAFRGRQGIPKPVAHIICSSTSPLY